MLRAPTGRGRDGTAGRFDIMRNTCKVSDRFGAQYRVTATGVSPQWWMIVAGADVSRLDVRLQRQRSGNTGLAGSIDKSR